VPRRPRIEIAGGVFHIIARGNARAPLFLDAFDYGAFVGIVSRAVETFAWRCFAFCLMPNHYHLVIETPKLNRGAGMRHLNGSYAQKFNARYDGSGHVFQGPYRATEIARDSHLLEVCRYVVLNPVRAGLCRDPSDWRWSSYRATADLEPSPRFLSVSDVLDQFAAGARSPVAGYRAFIAEGLASSATARDRVPGSRPGLGRGPGDGLGERPQAGQIPSLTRSTEFRTVRSSAAASPSASGWP
jgi:putative transposase